MVAQGGSRSRDEKEAGHRNIGVVREGSSRRSTARNMLRTFAPALYTLLYSLLLVLWIPLRLCQYLQKKSHSHLKERVTVPPSFSLPPEKVSRIWIHAVSVGEVNSIRPLIDFLRLDAAHLFISTTTETGQILARKLFGNRAQIFYFPMDWPWLCRRYLRRLNPKVVLITETEIWPGFIMAASGLGIPVVLINGRISDRSFVRYRRYRRILKPILLQLDRLCMQSRHDRDRVLELGSTPKTTHWFGNLKYDYSLPPNPNQVVLAQLAHRLFGQDPVWVCGSTRDGEEKLLLDAYLEVREKFPKLRLVLAPRHPERAKQIEDLLQQSKLSYLRRSSLTVHEDISQAQQPAVLILDTIGELPYVYNLAQVVFVGGSLVAWGGHNIIEAAHFGKPILVGPHMQNFREIAQTFFESYAALQVLDSKELARKLGDLLGDATTRKWLGQNARKVLRENRGAVRRTAELVGEYLNQRTAI